MGGKPLKIIVMSDSHGRASAVHRVISLHRDADLFLHLGDGEREVQFLMQADPAFAERLLYLKGNCDTGAVVEPTHRQLVHPLPFGHSIFAAHGDALQVKFSTARLAYEARKNGCDLALYGHTHVPECRYEDGLYIINPGSLTYPRDGSKASYALISISEKGILPNIVRL